MSIYLNWPTFNSEIIPNCFEYTLILDVQHSFPKVHLPIREASIFCPPVISDIQIQLSSYKAKNSRRGYRHKEAIVYMCIGFYKVWIFPDTPTVTGWCAPLQGEVPDFGNIHCLN